MAYSVIESLYILLGGRARKITISMDHPRDIFFVLHLESSLAILFRDMGSYLTTYIKLLGQNSFLMDLKI